MDEWGLAAMRRGGVDSKRYRHCCEFIWRPEDMDYFLRCRWHPGHKGDHVALDKANGLHSSANVDLRPPGGEASDLLREIDRLRRQVDEGTAAQLRVAEQAAERWRERNFWMEQCQVAEMKLAAYLTDPQRAQPTRDEHGDDR